MLQTTSRTTQVRALIVASCGKSEGTACPALLPLAGRCCIHYWLDTIRKCSRLQPLGDKVVIVCHPAHQQQLLSWAASAGLPASCIVPASSTKNSLSLVQGIAAAINSRPDLAGSYLLAADASYVLEPGSSLSHLVEAAVVRGKDTITSIVPLEGADLSHLVLVQKEDFSADNCRITAITAEAEGSADGCFNTVMGPVCILSPLTVPGILAAAAAQQHISAPQKALGACLEQQLKQDRPVYNFDLPFYFSVDGQEDYVITDAFFSHYTELHNRALCEVQQLAVGTEGAAAAHITGTVDELMTKLTTLGASHPPSAAHQQLMTTLGSSRSSAASLPGSGGTMGQTSTLSSTGGASGNGGRVGSSSLKGLFVEFYNKHQQTLSRKAKEAVQRDYSALPARFENPGAWDLHPKKQHACYNTSNNEYGAKAPTAFDMPLVWTGIQGKFTDTFHGGCYRHMGLKTSYERSRVHRALDNL